VVVDGFRSRVGSKFGDVSEEAGLNLGCKELGALLPHLSLHFDRT
jgi:hypothetical protein